MEHPVHTLSDLFRQLGLASDAAAIETFIARHQPLPARTALSEADFWNDSQRAFLQESVAADADWAEQVDELDVRLR